MDELTAQWDSLLERLRTNLEGKATVAEPRRGPEVPEPVFAEVEFRPVDGTEPQLTLVCLGEDDLLLSFGGGTNYWELDWAEDSIVQIERTAEAVCGGRCRQYSAPGRKHVEIELDDGTVVDTTTYTAPIGLIPLPGWLRRAKRKAPRP